MHRLVPEIIIDGYREGKFRGHLKAAGMFLDISGFSAMTDALMQHGQHGAEVLAIMMRKVFDPVVHSIFAHNGIIAGFAGDAITALFPATESDTLAAQNALAAAWDIQQVLKATPMRKTVYGEFPVSAKIGVASGEADWGILTSRKGDRAAYYFRGTAVDHSAHAEHHATAGDIILEAKIFAKLSHLVEAESHNEYHLVRQVIGALPEPQTFTLQPIDADIARRFFLDQIILEDLPGEFRQAVNLFIRFPDLPDNGMIDFMNTLFDLQSQYGGLITRVDFGDKGCNMILLWGAPVAYENDIDRALSFILDLQMAVDFPVNAGVTYYISRAGYIGSDLFEDFTCYGWGINLAARFMMNAPEGKIWIDERVARRVTRCFEVEYIGEQRFKGFTQGQKVYALLGRKTEVLSAYQGKLIGREVEIELLAGFVSPLWQSQAAGAMAIKGDAGIGKSRLVFEFRTSDRAKQSPVLWALCQSNQILQQSLNPFRYWLRSHFGITSTQTDDANKVAFNSTLQSLLDAIPDRELAAELDRTRSVLGSLLDLYWPDSLYERLDAQGRYDLSLLALMHLFQAESLRQPVIIFIEDAHYLDEDSREFLPRLKRSLTAGAFPYPIAILLTTRRQGIATSVDFTFLDGTLELAGLSFEKLAELSANILGSGVNPELLAWLGQRSEGNPYFAEQILRYLQDEKLITLQDGLWGIATRWDESTLPADISAVLIARLDQLALEVKGVIQTASVLGREFEVQVLAKMLHEFSNLSEDVSEAEQAAIWLPLSQMRYIFTHGLLRDAAYTMQMVARREELHVLAVSALEDLYKDDLKSHYGELAYHSEQASLTEKAILYLKYAAEMSRSAYQNTESLGYFKRALALLPENEREERINLHFESVDLLHIIGNRAEERRFIDTADTLARELGDDCNSVRVMLKKASFSNAIGEYQQSYELAQAAVRLALSIDEFEIATESYLNWADGAYRMSRFDEAKTISEDGLALARQKGNIRFEARFLNVKGMILLDMGEIDAGIECLKKGLELYRSINDLRGAAMPLNNLGAAFGRLGKLSMAFGYFDQSLAIACEMGMRRGEGLLLNNMGWICAMQGDFQNARFYNERSLLIVREVGDRTEEIYNWINLSGHACALGDTTYGISCAEKALVLSGKAGERELEAWALTYLGHNLLESGDFVRAAEVYLSACEIRQELGQPNLETEPLAGVARAALSMGNLLQAREYIEKILSHLSQGGSLNGTDDPVRVYANCYLGLSRMDDARATGILETAYKALNQRAASIDDPAARQRFFEDIPTNREIVQAWEQSRAV